MDVNKSLLNGFWVLRDGMGKVWVELKYEKLLDFCFGCGVLGYGIRNCGKGEREMSGKKDKYKFSPWMRASQIKVFGDGGAYSRRDSRLAKDAKKSTGIMEGVRDVGMKENDREIRMMMGKEDGGLDLILEEVEVIRDVAVQGHDDLLKSNSGVGVASLGNDNDVDPCNQDVIGFNLGEHSLFYSIRHLSMLQGDVKPRGSLPSFFTSLQAINQNVSDKSDDRCEELESSMPYIVELPLEDGEHNGVDMEGENKIDDGYKENLVPS
ncbi:hypothetical protein REPUB_Repub03eG0180100 [Reevesia pubescens]